MKYTDGRRRTRLFRQGRNRGPLVPISLIIIAILLAAFSLIKPFQFSTNLNINPANVVVPTWTPTPSPLPTPTDVHGGHIVFTCRRKDINQICLIRSDGTGYTQLTAGSDNAYYPVMAPDARTIIFALNQYDIFN